MERGIRDGALEIYGSYYHLEEISGMETSSRRCLVATFWDTVLWNCLRPTPELVKKEVRRRGRLEGNEAFDEFHHRQDVRRASMSCHGLDQVASSVAQSNTAFTMGLEQKRVEAKQRLGSLNRNLRPEESVKRWWKDAERLMEEWISDYVGKNRAALGLGADKSAWPRPQDVPTLLAFCSFNMARIYLNVGLRKKIDSGDGYDGHHYASACYADCIVTADKALRKTLVIVPHRPIDVLSFDDFALHLGVKPH